MLQTIFRTNRVAAGKSHGLMVDYIGIFDDVAKAPAFDEKAVQLIITILVKGLLLAQDGLPDDETLEKIRLEFSVLARLWNALAPDSCLTPPKTDYRWLGQVYESATPASGNGRQI